MNKFIIFLWFLIEGCPVIFCYLFSLTLLMSVHVQFICVLGLSLCFLSLIRILTSSGWLMISENVLCTHSSSLDWQQYDGRSYDVPNSQFSKKYIRKKWASFATEIFHWGMTTFREVQDNTNTHTFRLIAGDPVVFCELCIYECNTTMTGLVSLCSARRRDVGGSDTATRSMPHIHRHYIMHHHFHIYC
jgi:hypothetical protein